ncbi:MAG: hypothetical protein Q8Q09_16280 [Deltaproteobacteria bacterium]|nr:hypothetical protein [Deltaproteobacteria bacterium]
MPETQTSVPPSTVADPRPQAPQLRESVWVLTHIPLQRDCNSSHTSTSFEASEEGASISAKLASRTPDSTTPPSWLMQIAVLLFGPQ